MNTVDRRPQVVLFLMEVEPPLLLRAEELGRLGEPAK